MRLPHTITVFNKVENNYIPTVLKGVLYDAKKAHRESTNGNENSSSIQIIIPKNVKVKDYKKYVSPMSFDNESNKTTIWTVSQSDFIMKGELTEQLEIIKYSEIKESYENVVKVNSVRDVDFGDNSLHHFNVEGA
jgi:hypothetical protein